MSTTYFNQLLFKRPALVVSLLLILGLALFLAYILSRQTMPRSAPTSLPHTGTSKWHWNIPPHFPQPLVHSNNPMNAAKVDLGRHLFYDKRLSGDGTMSCASCHHQDKAFSDGLALSIGSTGEKTHRSAQPLFNMVYQTTLTWANPALFTLEQQMLVPIFGDNPIEMGVNDKNKDAVLARIASEPIYPEKFKTAFGTDSKTAVNWENTIFAIAAFQNALISANSRFDQYLQGRATMSATELRGQKLFFSPKAQCFQCHGSFNFNDQIKYAAKPSFTGISHLKLAQSLLLDSQDRLPTSQAPFHNTGIYNLAGTGNYPEDNPGLMGISGRTQDMGKFRAPSLRNVEVTAPYMHDGSIKTLEEVLAHYAAGGRKIDSGPHKGDGRKNPYKSPLLNTIALNKQEQADIIAFLKTLTDREFLTNPQYANPWASQP